MLCDSALYNISDKTEEESIPFKYTGAGRSDPSALFLKSCLFQVKVTKKCSFETSDIRRKCGNIGVNDLCVDHSFKNTGT